jgi:asparagine synthase (glutamine-hydrolysing)
MLAQLEHRGPDAAGMWTDGASVALGHTRLAIIDLNDSTQPMSSFDNRAHLVFNGEILNYRQVRRDFSAYPFSSNGDTEAILAAYETLGPRSVDRLRGQFAYAIYDERSAELHLFRDRLGILPLYYYRDDRMFAFASEIKALLPVIPAPVLDELSLDDYLAHRVVPAPHTLIKGVVKMMPGHHLVVGADGSIDSRPYWSVPNADGTLAISPQQAVDEVDQALTDSVREALVADVPVGVYLSGGVDSSLLAAMAIRERHDRSLQTFGATFGPHALDESYWAERVAGLLGTTHHRVEVTPDDFIAEWAQLSWFRDGPLSEPADVAVYRLAALARQHVKVVLSGEGSDEIFGGYPKHTLAAATRWSGGLPVRSLLLGLERSLPADRARLRVALRALSEPTRAERMRGWFAPFTTAERAALLGRSDVRQSLTPFTTGAGSSLQQMLYADMFTWLSDNLLERGDRMSMAASVETRPPFLDYRLVELAFRLPSRYKVRGRCTKWVLKEVARRYLPADVVDRPKIGFKVPLNDWFRGGLREFTYDNLTSSSSLVAGVFSPKVVTELLRSHSNGRSDEDIRIWTLLSLEIWYREMTSRGYLGSTGHQNTSTLGAYKGSS